MAKCPGDLFDLTPFTHERGVRKYAQLQGHLWTEHKAKLIQRYLRLFVFITHNGTYLDAFAGPQSKGGRYKNWAVKLVLESRPAWFKRFHLFELTDASYDALLKLKTAQPEIKGRMITVHKGDSNVTLPAFLAANPIKDSQATFCLLDQRTMECNWDTVKALATHKRGGNKIELFYFLAQGWIDRTFAAIKNDKDGKLCRWWGRQDWQAVVRAKGMARAQLFVERFKEELGYQYAFAFPIYERGGTGRAMFYMIHATDHNDATDLMIRAYNKGGGRLETEKQIELELGQHLTTTECAPK
jgi:three-Cys-motif partner protein